MIQQCINKIEPYFGAYSFFVVLGVPMFFISCGLWLVFPYIPYEVKVCGALMGIPVVFGGVMLLMSGHGG